MSDEKLREAYERALPSGEGRPPLDDVAAERLRRLVEREGSEEERLHTLDALLATAEGRRELEIAWGAARAARPAHGARGAWRVAAAAALLLAVGLGGAWIALRDVETAVRGDDSPITLVAPGDIAAASEVSRFVWRPLADAERYVFVIADGEGNPVTTLETRDTVVTIPAAVRLEAGREYIWWVEATTRLGATVTAASQRLKITTR